MNFSAEELKRLAAPLAILLAFWAAGAGLIVWIHQERRAADQQLAAARAASAQARERLMRIAEEEKEVIDKLEVYRRLKSLRILGDEQRLEWADAMTRIRTTRELLDLPADHADGEARRLAARRRALEQVGGVAERRERVAQLVGEGGQELVLGPAGPLGLGPGRLLPLQQAHALRLDPPEPFALGPERLLHPGPLVVRSLHLAGVAPHHQGAGDHRRDHQQRGPRGQRGRGRR